MQRRRHISFVAVLIACTVMFLHAVIPHSDISYIDYWLGEAVSFIESEDGAQALSKIEVLLTLCEQIPQTYALTFENIF